jgi:mannose-6-phosphate isomerase-like protein (cupin superfamily)
MDNSGWRTIVDSRTGDRITFEMTGAETNGAFVQARSHLPPHSPGPPRHQHRTFSESFTVHSGRLTILIADRVVRLGPGESATVPKGVAHTFRNDGDEAVEASGEVRPAAHFEEHLRALYGLSRDGRLDPINFALAARLGESLPAGPPTPIARMLVGVLAWIGDRLGRDGAFPEYTRPPTAPTKHPAG